MAPIAEKWTDIIYFQEVAKPVLYAENILDKSHLGQISVLIGWKFDKQQASYDDTLDSFQLALYNYELPTYSA